MEKKKNKLSINTKVPAIKPRQRVLQELGEDAHLPNLNPLGIANPPPTKPVQPAKIQ